MSPRCPTCGGPVTHHVDGERCRDHMIRGADWCDACGVSAPWEMWTRDYYDGTSPGVSEIAPPGCECPECGSINVGVVVLGDGNVAKWIKMQCWSCACTLEADGYIAEQIANEVAAAAANDDGSLRTDPTLN